MYRIVGWKLAAIHGFPAKISCKRFTSKTWTSKKVRQTFVDFFKDRDHMFVPSSSVVPKKNDGSYFVNAGMNQFKPLLLGTVDPDSEMATYSRVVNSQKCIRVGGKHNDLDDVGYDTYHHTFFEMLGNWSFANYFKKEACLMAWNLLTESYKIPESRLYVTYFGGCNELHLEPDLECRNLWIEIGVPPERVLPFGMKDNFWTMGNTGPCGPCTEIHFDYCNRSDASNLVNAGSPEVIELWNLVFMQFDRQVDGSLRQLPQRHVDTGMGLERVTAVLQGCTSNYDTDLFAPLFGAIQKGCRCQPYSGRPSIGDDDDGRFDAAYRIVADHTRMLSVAIGDGLLPGNRESEGKLRQIMHRCVHQAHHVLGSTPGFLGDLTSVVVDILGDVYPELATNRDQIRDVTNQTESRYLDNLVFGKQMITKALAKYGKIKRLSGEQLLEIQDGRFGRSVPADVVSLLAADFGLSADMEEFEKILQQKQEFSCAVPIKESSVQLTLHDIDFLKSKNVCPTNDSLKYDHSWTGDGYDFETVGAKIVALKLEGRFVDRVVEGNTCGVLFDRTNFYAEAGGQVADQGVIATDKGDRALISEVQVRQNYVLHTATLEQGSLNVGDTISLSPDKSRRQGCMLNHSATHLINFCLNKVLGNVRQQSSMVSDEKLAFEFTCSKASVSNEDLSAVTELANRFIQNASSVHRSVLPLNVAKSIDNLVTLTDEVYPSSVSVISIGIPITDLLDGKIKSSQLSNSVELCCGTHVDNLSHIGAVVITHFQGANQNTKRLIAVTGECATEALKNSQSLRSQLDSLSKAGSSVEAMEISQSIAKSLSDSRIFPKLERETAQKELEHLMLSQQVNQVKNEGKLVNLSKTIEKLLQENSSPSTFISSFDFAKTRDIVEVLVRLSPNHPTVFTSTSNTFTEVIVGVIYTPKEGNASFTSSQLAEFLCQSLQGSHSPPKGKLAKHTNIRVFSVPVKGNRTQEAHNKVLDLLRQFVTKADLQRSTDSISNLSKL